MNKPRVRDNIVEGRLFTHETEERDEWKTEKWRLRDLQNHPVDPNWENGQYLKCHAKARKNKYLRLDTIIFDLVGIAGKGNSRFIRSAFIIKKIKDGKLSFDTFFFADDKPIKSPITVTRTQYGVIVSRKNSTKLLEKMLRNGYNEYKASQKPRSINVRDWRFMKRVASRHIPISHICR